ncbi:hypothetical protein Q644_06645 [Brucella intermedia 229E]|uniref:Uncharacterized protein n=2 Tax=Brucella intermedia TaxID=94625 RepID=U4VBM3_9HYPH|nr:hypothetical protein Q644_06645 [Brucella intermedia 229E]
MRDWRAVLVGPMRIGSTLPQADHPQTARHDENGGPIRSYI